MSTTIGIDFGTTNSAVAVYDPVQDQVIAGNYEPTLIYFEPTNKQIYHIGQDAINKYLESGLDGRFIRSIKSVLHIDSFNGTRIYGKKFQAEELVALVLTYLREQGKEILGYYPERVVMGRPARFSKHDEQDALAEERLRKAAELSGFKEIRIQLEPIAAAFTYDRSIGAEELVLVGDFGGGTADFTLMRLGGGRFGKGDRSEDILAATGTRVGGDDFDAAIAWQKVVAHLGKGVTYDSTGRGKILPVPIRHHKKFCRWENHFQLNTMSTILELEKYHRWTQENERIGNFLTVIKENLGYQMFRSIEQAKIDLTAADTVKIAFHESGVDIEEGLELGEFASYLEPEMERVGETLDQLFAIAGVQEDAINSVFMTGGSSLVRPVRWVMENRFGKEKIQDRNAFTSVAQGLALTTVDN